MKKVLSLTFGMLPVLPNCCQPCHCLYDFPICVINWQNTTFCFQKVFILPSLEVLDFFFFLCRVIFLPGDLNRTMNWKYSKFCICSLCVVGSSKFHGSEWCWANSLCPNVAFLFHRAGIGSVLALLRLPYWFVSQPSRAKSSVVAQLWSHPTGTCYKCKCSSETVLWTLIHSEWAETRPFQTALGGTEQPILSGRDWELCVCCFQVPEAASSPSRHMKTLLVARPVWMLLGFSQGSRGKPWQRDFHGKGVTDYTLKRLLGSADLFIQTFLSSK